MTNYNGINLRGLKQVNKNAILKALAMHDTLSRNMLCSLTGLSKMTITNLVNEFIDEGVITEVGKSTSKSGPRTGLLSLVPTSKTTLAIFIERSYLNVGIVDLKGNILSQERITLNENENAESFMRKLFTVTDLIMCSPVAQHVWGIGISSVGPMDTDKGIILKPVRFHNIDNLNIVEMLHSHYNLPTYLEQDINVAALAELYFGQLNDIDSFLYIGIKDGVGCGVVINNTLFHGSQGFGCSLGHLTIDYNGPLCECGNRGCLELYGGLSAICNWAQEQYKKEGKPVVLSEWIELVSLAKYGDPIAIKAIERLAHFISIGTTSMINIFDPQCVFVGGSVGISSIDIAGMIEKEVNATKFSSSYKDIPVQMSRFSDSGCFVGISALVIERNLTYQP